MAGTGSCPGQTVTRAPGRCRLTSFAHDDAVKHFTPTRVHFSSGRVRHRLMSRLSRKSRRARRRQTTKNDRLSHGANEFSSGWVRHRLKSRVAPN